MTFPNGHALLIGVSPYNKAKLKGFAAVAADAKDPAVVPKN